MGVFLFCRICVFLSTFLVNPLFFCLIGEYFIHFIEPMLGLFCSFCAWCFFVVCMVLCLVFYFQVYLEGFLFFVWVLLLVFLGFVVVNVLRNSYIFLCTIT